MTVLEKSLSRRQAMSKANVRDSGRGQGEGKPVCCITPRKKKEKPATPQSS
jgi:hypothetical protein